MCLSHRKSAANWLLWDFQKHCACVFQFCLPSKSHSPEFTIMPVQQFAYIWVECWLWLLLPRYNELQLHWVNIDFLGLMNLPFLHLGSNSQQGPLVIDRHPSGHWWNSAVKCVPLKADRFIPFCFVHVEATSKCQWTHQNQTLWESVPLCCARQCQTKKDIVFSLLLASCNRWLQKTLKIPLQHLSSPICLFLSILSICQQSSCLFGRFVPLI